MRLKSYIAAIVFCIGLVLVDGYQDSAGHHDFEGAQGSICQTSCTSHMVVPNASVTPTTTQTHPINVDQPVVTSLTVTHSIFNPPKVLA